MADNEMKWEKTDENRYGIAGKEFQIEIWLDTDGTFSWRISKGIVSIIASGDYVENVDDLEADIYEALVKGYTEKQWGRACTELPAFIIKRLPVRFVFDNNYLNDNYQGVPVGGYNRLTEGLLNGVEVRTGVDFFSDREYWSGVADRIVFTGKIDEFYDCCFGKLEYRTVRFEEELLDMPNYQGNAVVNYTDREVPYTRIIEHKHFENFGQDVYNLPKTVISREYSVEWKDGMEPYYPVNDRKNSDLYAKYKALADKEENVIFGGRLAEYRYYDMAPVIGAAMEKFYGI